MNEIEKNYLTPGHPTAFAGKTLLYNYYPNTSKKAIDEMLEKINAYTLKREAKPVAKHNPYYVWEKRKLLQIDLIDFANDIELIEANNDIKYLLCIIDSFTRFLWVAPLQNKKAPTVLNAYRELLVDIVIPPQRLLCDRGSEFINRNFRQQLEKDRTTLIHPNNKAWTVERVQRTLQSLIYKYIEYKGKLKFVDVLPSLVQTYNTKVHRIIKMTPKEAELNKNRKRVRENLRLYYNKAGMNAKKKPKFKIGDVVRILANRGKFGRSYDNSFTQEVFKIYKINTNLAHSMYFVTDWYEEEKIVGSFYEQELQKIRGDVFKADVLKRRIRKGVKEVFVHWIGYPEERNEWIVDSTLYDTFKSQNRSREQLSTVGRSRSSV